MWKPAIVGVQLKLSWPVVFLCMVAVVVVKTVVPSFNLIVIFSSKLPKLEMFAVTFTVSNRYTVDVDLFCEIESTERSWSLGFTRTDNVEMLKEPSESVTFTATVGVLGDG